MVLRSFNKEWILHACLIQITSCSSFCLASLGKCTVFCLVATFAPFGRDVRAGLRISADEVALFKSKWTRWFSDLCELVVVLGCSCAPLLWDAEEACWDLWELTSWSDFPEELFPTTFPTNLTDAAAEFPTMLLLPLLTTFCSKSLNRALVESNSDTFLFTCKLVKFIYSKKATKIRWNAFLKITYKLCSVKNMFALIANWKVCDLQYLLFSRNLIKHFLLD